jgi:hypothetical protein
MQYVCKDAYLIPCCWPCLCCSILSKKDELYDPEDGNFIDAYCYCFPLSIIPCLFPCIACYAAGGKKDIVMKKKLFKQMMELESEVRTHTKNDTDADHKFADMTVLDIETRIRQLESRTKSRKNVMHEDRENAAYDRKIEREKRLEEEDSKDREVRRQVVMSLKDKMDPDQVKDIMDRMNTLPKKEVEEYSKEVEASKGKKILKIVSGVLSVVSIVVPPVAILAAVAGLAHENID